MTVLSESQRERIESMLRYAIRPAPGRRAGSVAGEVLAVLDYIERVVAEPEVVSPSPLTFRRLSPKTYQLVMSPWSRTPQEIDPGLVAPPSWMLRRRA